jgi:hypothetical protein
MALTPEELQEKITLEQELLNITLARREEEKENLKFYQSSKELDKEINQIRKEMYENYIKYLKLEREITGSTKENTQALLEAQEELRQLNKELKETSKAYEKQSKLITIVTGKLKQLAMMTVNATLAYDAQRAELGRLTGGLAIYNSELATAMNQASLAGLTFQEAGKGFAAIGMGLTSFTSMTSQSREQLAILTSQMQRLGMESFAQNLDLSIQGLGMTKDQAVATQQSLLELGSALGPKFKKMIDSEFGPAMQTLAAHTKNRAIQVFKGLAIQARMTGLEISKLLAFSEQFDTFEGAASAVGKLNAALGGNYFNSLELLRASEEDRIKMIREGISLSGKRFQDLSRFEKKFFAQALGVSSVADAQKLLRTEQEKEAEELERLTKQGEKFGLSAEQMKARIEATRTISEQFKIALQNLAIVFKPAIDALSKAVKFLAELTEGFKKSSSGIIKLIPVLALLLTSLVAIRGTLFLISKGGGLIGGLLGIGGKATAGGMIGALKPLAIALGAITVAMFALGVAMVPFGKGLKALAEGLAAIGPVFEKYGALTLGGQLVGFLSSLVVSAVGGLGLVSLAAGVNLVGNSIKELGENLNAIPRTTTATLNFKTNINAQELQPKITIDFQNLPESKKNMEKAVNEVLTKVGKITRRMNDMTTTG